MCMISETSSLHIYVSNIHCVVGDPNGILIKFGDSGDNIGYKYIFPVSNFFKLPCVAFRRSFFTLYQKCYFWSISYKVKKDHLNATHGDLKKFEKKKQYL